jgi:hypothetical protein
MDPADRDVTVDACDAGDKQLVPTVIDHQRERQPARV